jgi:hypothetical protein
MPFAVDTLYPLRYSMYIRQTNQKGNEMQTKERNYPEMDMDELMAEEYATANALIRLRVKGLRAPKVWTKKLKKIREDMEFIEDSLTERSTK